MSDQPQMPQPQKVDQLVPYMGVPNAFRAAWLPEAIKFEVHHPAGQTVVFIEHGMLDNVIAVLESARNKPQPSNGLVIPRLVVP